MQVAYPLHVGILALSLFPSLASAALAQGIGAELGLPTRLQPGQEFGLSARDLFNHGAKVFAANFTASEGQGRPLTKGTGAPLADSSDPLVFPRDMNRISGPDANSCAGCHNAPFPGGSGDFVTNVFVLGQRFDEVTFDSADPVPTKGNLNEVGQEVTLDSVANSRQTVGMFGSGLIEMLARQITADLRTQRDGLQPGGSVALTSKGISFGGLSRDSQGNWITSQVEGLPAPSLSTSGPNNPPNLIVRPFHQAGAVISLRQFTNNAMNHHHGIQTVERFGAGLDPDGDSVVDELSIPDVSAASVYQAGLDIPGRLIPSSQTFQRAVAAGERTFVAIGCSACHVPSLPLDQQGWVFTEPNPFNPSGNLLPSDSYTQQFGTLSLDLTDPSLPGPRPAPKAGVLEVFAFTDFKLHDITSGPNDPNREALDMHAPAGSAAFFAGNSRFVTGRLWGVANQMPFYHHGHYTTMRQAIEAHAGEASGVMAKWQALQESERLQVIEFLKSLRILPRDAAAPIIDDQGKPLDWPAFPWVAGQPVPSLP